MAFSTVTMNRNETGGHKRIFMMFGKYTSESTKGISSERTKEAVDVIKKHGGRVVSMYAMLGKHDLVLTLDLPNTEALLPHRLA